MAFFLSLSSAVAQDTPACSSCAAETTAQSQTQEAGAAFLTRLSLLAGWAYGRAQQGVVASGTVSRLDSQGRESEPETIKIEMTAARKLRLEIGSDQLIVSNAVATRKMGGASRAALMLTHVAISQIAPYFPFLTDLSATNDPDVQVGETSTATINGEAAIGVVVHRSFAANVPFRAAREKSSPLKIWISEKTGLPVKVDFVRLATDNWNVPITYSLYYSAWSQVDGVLVPMQIDEGIEPRVFLRYRFSSIAFNNQIPDSDFSAGGAN